MRAALKCRNAVSYLQIAALTTYKIVCCFAPERDEVMSAVRFRLIQTESHAEGQTLSFEGRADKTGRAGM